MGRQSPGRDQAGHGPKEVMGSVRWSYLPEGRRGQVRHGRTGTDAGTETGMAEGRGGGGRDTGHGREEV